MALCNEQKNIYLLPIKVYLLPIKKYPLYNKVYVRFLCKDLELGNQPSYIFELLQDEDVSDIGCYTHDLRCGPQHI